MKFNIKDPKLTPILLALAVLMNSVVILINVLKK
ncbi:hypothetical protein FUSNEC_GEN_300_09340 [Fusobacterium necrophorum subsp. funduliforme]|nr:hypothetical protein FSEG_02146 [Fusobacterium necrophorum D12]